MKKAEEIMHDPMTIAHEIRLGKLVLVTVWHVDPETDGTDNSCGWFQPHLTEQDLNQIEDIVTWDLEFPFYTSPKTLFLAIADNPKYPNLFLQSPGECLGYVAAAWQKIARVKSGRRHKLTADEWWAVVNLATNPDDNLQSILADAEEQPKERAQRFLYWVMRQYLRYHRSWWRHPRWHVHHWHFQVHPLQTLKRWLFSRCDYCGERFPWGYAPSAIFGGGGSRWFKSEKGCYHRDCHNLAFVKRERGIANET